MSDAIYLDLVKKRRAGQRTVFFAREELMQMLALYSEHVAQGHWRDYAIDHTPGIAIFSFFRHTHEAPQFSIFKSSVGGGAFEYSLASGSAILGRSARLGDMVALLRRKMGVQAVS